MEKDWTRVAVDLGATCVLLDDAAEKWLQKHDTAAVLPICNRALESLSRAIDVMKQVADRS